MSSLIQRNLAFCLTVLLFIVAAIPASANLTASCKKNDWSNYELSCGGTYVSVHTHVEDCLKAGKEQCASACEATTASCKKNDWSNYELSCGGTYVSVHAHVEGCLKAGKELCP